MSLSDRSDDDYLVVSGGGDPDRTYVALDHAIGMLCGLAKTRWETKSSPYDEGWNDALDKLDSVLQDGAKATAGR